MTEIVFRKDQFRQFRATREVAVGQAGYRTSVGEIIEFDGYRLRFGSGDTMDSPHMRSAISSGWFVPHDGSEPEPQVVVMSQAAPPPSRIKVVQYEDQIVSSRTAEGGFQADGGAASRILSQLSQLDAPRAPAPAPVQEGGRKKYAITRQEEFEGEGTPIKSLRPQVQEIPKAVGAEGIYEDQRMVTRVNSSVPTKAGVSIEDSARVHKSSTESVIMGQSAVVGTNRDSTPPQIRKMTLQSADDSTGVPVSRLRTPTTFGSTQINASTSVESHIAAVERQARVIPGVAQHGEVAPDPVVEAPAKKVVAKKQPQRNFGKLVDRLRLAPEDAEQAKKALTTLQKLIPGFQWDLA